MMTDAVSHQKSEESTFEDVTLLAASITGHAFSRKGFLCLPMKSWLCILPQNPTWQLF